MLAKLISEEGGFCFLRAFFTRMVFCFSEQQKVVLYFFVLPDGLSCLELCEEAIKLVLKKRFKEQEGTKSKTASASNKAER